MLYTDSTFKFRKLKPVLPNTDRYKSYFLINYTKVEYNNFFAPVKLFINNLRWLWCFLKHYSITCNRKQKFFERLIYIQINQFFFNLYHIHEYYYYNS